MGCPDAVCAAVQSVPGIQRLEYHPQREVFYLEYDPARLTTDEIFAAVVQGGKKMGQEYRPRILS
jgi:copper chaperone CopZ